MIRLLLLTLVPVMLIQNTCLSNNGTAESLPDLSKFKDLTQENDSAAVFADTFDRGNQGWGLYDNFKIVPNEGINGTAAMFYERTDPKSYPLLAIPIKLDHDKIYKASFSFRLSALKRHGSESPGEFGAIEYEREGRYHGGAYSRPSSYDIAAGKTYDLNSGDWQEAAFEFQPREGLDKAFVRLYLQRDYTGKIWWDNLTIEKTGSLLSVIYDVEPCGLKLDADGKMAFSAAIYINPKPQNTALLVTAGHMAKLFKPVNGIYAGNFENLPLGNIKVSASLLNMENNTIIGKKEFVFFRQAANQAPQGSSFIDQYGRAIVDGKPFLPIGIFGHSLAEGDMKRLAENGFNCYMPYSSMFMTPEGLPMTYEEKNRKHCFSELDASMDLFSKYNLKVIFSVMYQLPASPWAMKEYENIKGTDAVTEAMVNRYKNHPALLAWYLSDENPRKEVPELQKLRELVNKNDPSHFSVALTYNIMDFPFFASTGDVLAVDIYPVLESAKPQGMTAIPKALKSAGELKKSVWFVPQAFNWGTCKGLKPGETEAYKKYRWPTDAEIRAMALAGAVNGAKGFIFFSYSMIFKSGELMEPGSSKHSWPAVVSAAKMLKELEPFILSIKKAPFVKIHSASSGKVEAGGWTADSGRICVGVVGIETGVNEAEFTVENNPDLKSRYGLTTNLGNSKYRFKGENISSDILY